MSYTKVTFCGLNVARLLNYLCKSGLNVLSVTKCGQTCTVVVAHRDKKRLLDVLNDRCYTVTQVQNFGGTTCLTFAKRHFVLLVAILLMVVGCGILSNHCCKIVVTGDVEADVVLAQMDTLGVNVGANLKDVNIDHLENALATRLDVMYAVVTRKGAVLYVDTIAKKQIDAPIDMHKRRDIVAIRDGVVQSVLCEQGTPVVKGGDVVKIGDVLIEGTRRFNDDTCEDVYALGKVVLVESVSAFVPYTGTKTELQPTGNCQTFTQVVLFGKTYGKVCNYTNYQVETKSTYLHPLNLCVQRVTYHEMALVTVKATFDECLPQLTQQSLQLAQSKCNFVVTNTQFVTSNGGVTAILQGQRELT